MITPLLGTKSWQLRGRRQLAGETPTQGECKLHREVALISIVSGTLFMKGLGLIMRMMPHNSTGFGKKTPFSCLCGYPWFQAIL